MRLSFPLLTDANPLASLSVRRHERRCCTSTSSLPLVEATMSHQLDAELMAPSVMFTQAQVMEH